MRYPGPKQRSSSATIGGCHDVALLLAGKRSERMHGGDFHGARDRGGADVERSSKNEWKAQNIVHLVGIVAAPGRKHGIGTHRQRQLGQNFGRRIGECQDQRPGCHLLHHGGREHAARRQAQEHVRRADHLIERASLRFLREARLLGVHQLPPAFEHDPRQIRQPDIFAPHAEIEQQVDTGQRGSTRAAHDQLRGTHFLVTDRKTVEHRGTDRDRGTVLVVVKHGNLHSLAQLALDDEALRRLDVFQVDRTECRLECRDDLDQLVGVGLLDLDVEYVDAGEFLEQHRLAFHHRLCRQRTDGTQPKHGRAIADDADQIAARGVAKRAERIRGNRLRGRRHPGRISEREIALRDQLFGGSDRDLAVRRKLVVVERCLPAIRLDVGGLGAFDAHPPF